MMKFLYIPPAEPHFLFGTSSTIYADGSIDQEAPLRFEQLVAERRVKENSTIYLNSPGGSLAGGLALGRAIRRAGLFTYIGRHDGTIDGGVPRRHATTVGGCYSAATLAFLGGTYRWIGEGCVFGVHRFYASSSIGDDLAQITSAKIIEYIREMGADPAIFTEMTRAGRSEINELSSELQSKLNITNGPLRKAKWTVESDGSVLFLNGELTSWRGSSKFILSKEGDRAALLAMFNPEGREHEAVEMGAHSLMIDGEPIPIEAVDKPRVMNSLVAARFYLRPELVAKIGDASTVGVAFQFFHGHPFFLGFDGMETSDGKKIIGAFLRHLV